MTAHWPDGEPKVILECTCGVEGLVISGVNWDDWKEIWLMFYSMGHHGKCKCWRCRLRHIWEIVRHGTPYTDMICLDARSARIVAQKISDYVDILEEEL